MPPRRALFRSARRPWRVVHVALAVALALAFARSAGATTYYVDRGNPSASDGNPGTLSAPYLTIGAAVSAHGAAGNTIVVEPGTYPEQVSVGASGASGSPFVVQAAGAGVTVDAADDFSATARWTLVSGSVYRAGAVTWSPVQVFVDGARLTASTASASSIPSGSFEYVSGSGLYVNVGGNPGSHQTLVGHRSYGFTLSSRSYVTIQGFAVTHAENRGISVSSCTNALVTGNRVSLARYHGIYVSGGSSNTLASNLVANCGDHGIYLTGGVTSSVVRGNESYGNARPDVRAANGIMVYGSTGIRVEGNRCHDNQDSGFQNNTGANNNLYVQNLSWNNGDHGFDHLSSTGVTHIGDVSYHNFKDGFSIEGNATGCSLYDCIAIDNGLTTNEYDLWIDDASFVGFTGDYNLFWNSTSQAPVKIGSSIYSTVSAYAAAKGQDAHSKQANPKFVNAAGGDFHLLAGSPAIDDATSAVASWPATDADGKARFDDPATGNTGAGSVLYADRGAFEYQGSGGSTGSPPVARLTVTPSSGYAPLPVSANASASTDPDNNIASYRFDCGDGAVTGPQSSSSATHTFAIGSWIVRVTVTDATGLSSTGTAGVTVTENPDHAPVVSAPATVAATEAQTVSFSVTASDPDGQAIGSLTADLSGLPAGSNATFVAAPGNASGTFTWTPSYAMAGAWRVTFTATNTRSGSDTTTINVANVDRAPTVTAPASVSGREGTAISFSVTAADPDGDAITSLTANLSGLPAGNNAKFTPASGNLSGTFTWTPGYSDSGSYSVTFRAANAMSVTATTALTIANTDRPPVVSAPSGAKSRNSSLVTFTVTASDPDRNPITALTADLSKLPGATFVVNATNTSGTFRWTPVGVAQGDYAVTFVASNALTGRATTSIQVRKPLAAAGGPALAGVPTTLWLSNAQPSPAPGAMAFTLEMPDDGVVELTILDVAGRVVWNASTRFEAGVHVLAWDGTTLHGGRGQSGVYYARVRVGDQTFARRVVLL